MCIYWLVESASKHPELMNGAPPEGILSWREAQRWASFRVPKRRHDWLLGRWTAKRLLQAVIADMTGAELPLDQLVIENEGNGAPVWCCEKAELYPFGSISISHSHDWAFSAVCTDDVAVVGADIEWVESRPFQFAEEYFADGELEQLRSAPPEERDVRTTTIWSAKEAALKALRLGLLVDTRSVICTLPDRCPEGEPWWPLELACRPEHLPSSEGRAPKLLGWWKLLGNHVLTLAVLDRSTA